MSENIPSDWVVKSLESICSWIGVGIATSTTHAYTASGVPILRNQNILPNSIRDSDMLHITEEFSEENKSKMLHSGDIVSIRTGYPGVSAVVPEKYNGCHSFTTLISRPDNYLVDSFYLSVLINSDYGKEFVLGGQAGGAQQNLNVSVLKQFPVILPPLPEQQKIAAILTSVDEVIEKTQAQIDKLKDLKTGMMQQLLTSGVGVDGKPHTEFKDSTVGRIPKGWGVTKLGAVAVIQTGAAKSSKLTGELIELPYLRVANVQDGYLNLDEIKTIKIPISKSKRFLLEKNDVLVNEGGDFDKLGRGSIWAGQIIPCAHQNHVFVVRTDKAKLSSMFFNHLSGSEYGKKYYMGCAKQTTNLASINSTQLKQFPVLLPTVEEQGRICNALDSVDENISRHQEKLLTISNLKKALMQDLLTGKVRVTVPESPTGH